MCKKDSIQNGTEQLTDSYRRGLPNASVTPGPAALCVLLQG